MSASTEEYIAYIYTKNYSRCTNVCSIDKMAMVFYHTLTLSDLFVWRSSLCTHDQLVVGNFIC